MEYKYKERVFGNDPRLVLPFYSRQGKLIGVSGRALNNNKLRYLTLKFDETEPLIYGLRTVDYNKRVYVTEGPIDSLFLPNSISVAGSDFSKLNSIVPPEQAVVVFDNEPRNKEIISRMEKVIDNGWNICIWPESVTCKDLNDMILASIQESRLIEIINMNTYNGLLAKTHLTIWRKK